MWELELVERGEDGTWNDGDGNYDPWPDPTVELKRGPTLLLTDLRGLVAPERAQYVVGGMASPCVATIEVHSATKNLRAPMNGNRAFLVEVPATGTPIILAALGTDDKVST